MTNKTPVTILAVIGGFVALGWLLKVTFKLLGLLIVVGAGIVLYLGARKLIGGRE